MKSIYVAAVPVLTLLITQVGWCYRLDITEAGEKTFCTYRPHLTFKPSATCCDNQVVHPALKMEDHWDACQSTVTGNTIEKIAWDMYICILKKVATNKEQVTLLEFAELIGKDYPADIKSKISAEVQKQNLEAAPLTAGQFKKLDKIRVTYYDIETAVCKGETGGTYGAAEPKCSDWKEESHRSGMCCKGAYPVDIRYKTLMEVGDPAEVQETCKRKFLPSLIAMNITNTFDALAGTLFDICEVACVMDGRQEWSFDSGILRNHYYWEFNVSKELYSKPSLFLPDYFTDEVKMQAIQYVISVFSINQTIDEMRNYTFADAHPFESHTVRSVHFTGYSHVVRNLSTVTTTTDKQGLTSSTKRPPVEFAQRPFHRGHMHIPVLCAAYNQIAVQLEYFLFERKKNCMGEPEAEPQQVEEPPKPEPEQEPTPEPESRK